MLVEEEGKSTRVHSLQENKRNLSISMRPNQIAVLVGTSGSEIGVDVAAW